MKKLFIAIAVMLTGCAGYQPLYGELGGKMEEIGIKQVKMKTVKRDVGQRRLAQKMNHHLERVFTNNITNQYDLYVELDPRESSIATRSDDTDKRKNISVTAYIKLTEKDKSVVEFSTKVSRQSSYTVQVDPFATQSARTKALESIVASLSNDIIQRSALWFRGYKENENY